MKRILAALSVLAIPFFSFSQTVSFTVNTTAPRRAISPFIYGINHTAGFAIYNSPENYGSFRLGGNRLTGYNWETNASNAGEDYINNSDEFLCATLALSATQCNTPGGVITKFKQLSGNQYALATLPLAGYVAADKNGPVSQAETAPSIRWKQIQHQKGSAFSLTPNTSDNVVYSDEAVNYWVTTLGNAGSGGIRGYNLDNEPGLWSSVTHPRLHPSPAGAVELLTKSAALARAIKSVDAGAETFGGVFYGFSDYYSLQSAPDWPSVQGSYAWYIDYFLDRMRLESNASGRRLLDVLDLHWYPEAVGDQRITGSTANSAADRQARMQAPRTLWDANYRENSWIAASFSSYLPLIPRIKASINQYNAGTRLSLSEYNYGGGSDISGGIAQADLLGIFGKYDMYSAQLWPLNSNVNYLQAAFRLYRNYNGAGRTFGDTYVQSSTSDSVTTSVYASIDGSNDSTLHLILINKSSAATNTNISLNAPYNTVEAWRLDGTGAALTNLPAITINSNSFSYSMAPLSVYHLVLRKNIVLPVKLKSFNVTYDNGKGLATWQTATETGVQTFELQRSCNGQWKTVATVPAKNSLNGAEYLYADPIADECKTAAIRYQLKLTERDGGVSFSKVVIVPVKEMHGALQVFPNPAGAYITLAGLSGKAGKIRIKNAQGQLLKTVLIGRINQLTIPVDQLSIGTYWLEADDENGSTRRIQFMKAN